MKKESEHIVRYTMDELKAKVARGEDQTDHNMSQEEAMRRRALDPEAVSFDFDQLDPTIVSWFRTQGDGYETLINDVLRSYIASQEPRV